MRVYRPPATDGPIRHRSTAERRREDIVRCALREFAGTGLHGTSTERIATCAGVSQPYIFRLFGTKKQLFLAAGDLAVDRILATFREAATGADPGTHPLHAMGRAYEPLLQDRDLLLFQLQLYAACGDPEVQQHVCRRYQEVAALVESLPGVTAEQVQGFLATGAYINIILAMGVGQQRSTLRSPHCSCPSCAADAPSGRLSS